MGDGAPRLAQAARPYYLPPFWEDPVHSYTLSKLMSASDQTRHILHPHARAFRQIPKPVPFSKSLQQDMEIDRDLFMGTTVSVQFG